MMWIQWGEVMEGTAEKHTGGDLCERNVTLAILVPHMLRFS